MALELNLKGKNVLVTGGSKGLGLAAAKGFAAEGCNIYLSSRNAEMLENKEYMSTFDALTPLGPYGQPEDFGPIVSLLLSHESSWITGQVFAVDGGMTLRAYGGRLQAPA